MKTKNSGEGNQWSQCVQRRYVQKASLPDITAVRGVSSLSGELKTAHHSPASESLWKTGEGGGGGKPFAQGWTHTHTLTLVFSDSVPTLRRKVKERKGA